MAKPHSGKRDDNLLTQIATPVLPLSPVPSWQLQPQPTIEISDRRTWHPEGDQRPARSISSAHRLKVAPGPRNKVRYPSAHVAFRQPQTLDVCVRRKTRRQVLHALKRTRPGRGKSKRRSYLSTVRCR